jgi:hypothetical protein
VRALISVVAVLGLAACQPAPVEAAGGEGVKTKAELDAEAWATRQAEARRPLDPDKTVKVALFRDGRIEIDGVPTEAEQVGDKMHAAAASKQFVVYYRENAEAGLSAQQKGVMPAILGSVAANLLQIRFSYEPDFSDTLIDRGNP